MHKEQVLSILRELKPNVDFETETRLIDDGILDSFDIVLLTTRISDTFGINIPVEELKAENLNSAAAVCDLVERLAL